jgi:PAS domain S-box-containing protein
MLMSTPLEHEELSSAPLRDGQPLLSQSDAPKGMSEPPKQSQAGFDWRRVREAVWTSAFSPRWLPVPWNFPVVGYIAAVCLSSAMILLSWLLHQVFLTVALLGMLPLLAILLVALLWGTGPALIATLIGALLFNFVILPPSFTWNFSLLQPVLETVLFLVIGVTISLIVSRIEYARAQVVQEKAQAAGQARELEAILATIADGVYVYDADGRLLRANPSGQAFNPYTLQEDYLESSFPERFASFLLRDEHGQPFTAENMPVKRALRGEKLTGTQTVDIQMRTIQGEDRFYSVSGAPIRDEAAQIQGAVIVTRDVTERRRIERESTEQARQLSILFEAVPDAITVFDREGRIVRTNESARKLWVRFITDLEATFEQRHKETQLRNPHGDLLNAETVPTFRLLQGEMLTGEHAQDVIVHTFDNEDLWLSVAGAPLYDDAGELNGAVAVMRDLTVQYSTAQRTREALQALLQFAEALVQAGVTGGSGASESVEGEDRVDEVAKRLASLMGQVLSNHGATITVFKEGSQRAVATAAHGMLPEQEQGWRERRRGYTIQELVAGTSVEHRLQNGEAVIIDLSTPPFSAHPTIYGSRKVLLVPMTLEGRATGVVSCIAKETSHDYSEEEIALARGLAQLATLTLERTRLFQERTQEQATVLALRETNRLMDEFIGIAGHELRTPLTTIKGSVELARRQANKILAHQERLPDDVVTMMTTVLGHLERTERQIRMQNRLISDLLDVARIHSNRLELYPELCDLLTVVRESVEDQQHLTPTRMIELRTDAPDEVLVMADGDRVRQVISNYLSNALKYSQADKLVEVRLELAQKHVRVFVRDEGPGLSEVQQHRIWERFYRVPEVEVKSGSGVGLGLGLHISRMIIERLGGKVGVESTPGQGSVFWFTLPLVEIGELG